MFGWCYQWMAMVWRPVRWSGPPFPRPVTTGGPSPTGPVNSAFEKLNWRKGQKHAQWGKVPISAVYRGEGTHISRDVSYWNNKRSTCDIYRIKHWSRSTIIGTNRTIFQTIWIYLQNAYVRLFSKVLLWKKVSLKLVFRIRVPKELNYFFDSEFKTWIQIRPEVLLAQNYYYQQENQVINISAARRAFFN